MWGQWRVPGLVLPTLRAEVSSLTQEERVGPPGGPGMATFVFQLPQGRPGRRQRPLIFVKKAQLSCRARADLAQLRPASELLLPDQRHGQEGRPAAPVRPLLGRPLAGKALWGSHPPQTPAVPEMRWPGHGSSSL